MQLYNLNMDFLNIVKTLYPNVYIRTINTDGKIKFHFRDIIMAFELGSMKQLRDANPALRTSLTNVNNDGTFTIVEYLTEEGVRWLLENFTHYPMIKKIQEELAKSRNLQKFVKISEQGFSGRVQAGSITTGMNSARNSISIGSGGDSNNSKGRILVPQSNVALGLNALMPVIRLTDEFLRNRIESIFKDDVFMYNVSIGGKYTSSMYMPKYNISFELPGIYVDHALRTQVVEKTKTCCIQIHNETTFSGDLLATFADFGNAIGVAFDRIKKSDA